MKKDQINILIVDDDDSSREAFGEAVKRAGYRAILVGKIEDALNAVRIKQIHGAIVDCMLPRMNGIQLSQELRSSRFGNAPIILVSGIFKDRAFSQDALIKTQAIEYFTKPVVISQMIELLDKHLEELIDAPKIPLHALLSKPYASDRERLKALESIDQVTGLDLPLILSILLDSESSGYLNVITSGGDICGITLNKGSVLKVDTPESSSMVGGLLVDKGFLTTKDFEELPAAKRRGDILKHLITENLISPHASVAVKREQILVDLSKLIREKSVQINFVPERIREKSELGMNSQSLTPFYREIIRKEYNLKWFDAFYHDWLDHPMRHGPEFSKDDEILSEAMNDVSPKLKEVLSAEKTIEEIFSEHDWDKEKFYKVLHLIALRRLIIFDDVKRAKDTGDQLERLKIILKDIEKKNPFEIFEYFGAGPNPNTRDVEKVYKEFARSNHPDTLSSAATDELKDIVHKVYASVSDAYDVLSNEGKRERFVNSMRQKEAERQLRSEGIAEEGIVLLRRGKVTGALEKINQALKLYESQQVITYWCWATLKSYLKEVPYDVQKDVQTKLEMVPHENRRSPTYLYVSGLLKKASGDYEGAHAQFDKSLALNPNFLDVRREISSLKRISKESTADTFTGELTSIVGKLFKKQAKK